MMREQRELASSLGLKGRMLLAEEGVNATFEGSVRQINKYKKAFISRSQFKNVVFKESAGNGRAFSRLEVKVRPEIVTLGQTFDVRKETAKTISASELHKMYKKGEEFTILDLRNDYEINVGAFDRTEHPNLQNFRELPEKLESIKHLKNKKTIAVCTGDIRCEKATCLLQQEGFENLYHLEDGIHAYMQKYPGKKGFFKGSLFVFDNRMTTPVVEGVEREIIGRCIYCGKKSEEFYSNDTVRPSRKVISCARCAREHARELRKCAA